ncbi:MAG: LamB/YcsF family protein [Candidatus Limnocylindrales bacterium]
MRIDLNADVGEGYGRWPLGDDPALIPLVSSVNIACGFHAGDPATIERTIQLALAAGAAIGAHPGYPDREGFGRRDMALSAPELEAAVLYQVAAVAGMTHAWGGTLRHVKAHGALYNRAVVDAQVAEPIARAVRRAADGLRHELALVGPPGSALLTAALACGLRPLAEGFVDRAYEPDGTLRSRRLEGALLSDPAAAVAQALALVGEGRVRASDGSWLQLEVETLCLHGDTPGAAGLARRVRAALEDAGHEVGAPLEPPVPR